MHHHIMGDLPHTIHLSFLVPNLAKIKSKFYLSFSLVLSLYCFKLLYLNFILLNRVQNKCQIYFLTLQKLYIKSTKIKYKLNAKDISSKKKVKKKKEKLTTQY